MQSTAARSFIVSVLIACNGNASTSNEDSKSSAEQPPSAAEGALATRDTDVTFNISGLSAWTSGDSLQLISQRSGVVLGGLESSFAAAPRGGDTTVAGQAINWKHTFAPLVDAAKGDQVMVTQLVAATSNGRPYSALARAGVAQGFSLRDGQPASLAATLAALKQDRTLALRWNGAAFAALTSQASASAGAGALPAPAATVSISAISQAQAGSLTGEAFLTSLYAGLPSLVTFSPLPGEVVDQAVAYANPFPSLGGTWHELATAVYAASVPVPTRWGVGSVPARFVAAVPVSSLGKTGELAPQLSPVSGVKIDAGNVRWHAPTLGKATSYSVVVSAVTGSDQGVDIKAVAQLSTKATSLQLPALAAGTYVLTITAIAQGEGHAFASADHVTAQLTL
jgi:hypothetical protein